MLIENCHRCTEFLQNAALSLKEHLDATGKFTQAMRNDRPDPEISALEKAASMASLRRIQAATDYKQHIEGHALKAAALATPNKLDISQLDLYHFG